MSDTNPQSCSSPILGESVVTPTVVPAVGEKPLLPTSAQPQYLQLTRLGIIHLLAWITATAVLMKIDTVIAADKQFELSALLWLRIVENILAGAGLVGVGILLLTLPRQKEGYLQPGHWLVMYACLKILVKKFTIINVTSYSTIDIEYCNYFLVSYGLIWAVFETVALFWFTTKIPESGHWSIFFRLWASVLVISIFIKGINGIRVLGVGFVPLLPLLLLISVKLISIFFENWPPIFLDTINAPLLFLPIPIMLDVLRGSRRDWVHWLGVSMVFCESVSIPIQVLFQ